MKKLLLLILLLISISTYSQKNVGYLVSINIDSISHTNVYKIDSIDIVNELFNHYAGIDLDLSNVFINDILFFEFRHNHINFYCEKKRIIYKKNGKVVYRKIKINKKQWKGIKK